MTLLPRLIEDVDFHSFLFHYNLGRARQYKFPDNFYEIAAGLEREFGEIKEKIGVNNALKKLCDEYENNPEKTHLQVFMRMKLERDLEL